MDSTQKWMKVGSQVSGDSEEFDGEETCRAIGSKIASMFSQSDTQGLFYVSENTLDILIVYFAEIELLSEDEGPYFTETAKKWARRYMLNSAVDRNFVMIDGEIEIKDHNDEIPSRNCDIFVI